MKNNKKETLRQIADHEGFRPTIYKDTTGNPTIGFGFNLAAPETLTTIKSFGYDPEKLYNEQQAMTVEDAVKIKEELVNRSKRRVQDIFSDIPLTNNQLDSLTSLHYNNPSLIGENLRRYVMKGDFAGAAKEIAFRSNRAKDPGIAKRRLKEANTFYDNKFGTLDIEPEYAEQTSKYFDDLGDTAETRQLKLMFPNIDTSRRLSLSFPKINTKLGRAPASISNTPAIDPYSLPPIPYAAPELENFETPDIGEFDPLEQFNLLKRKMP